MFTNSKLTKSIRLAIAVGVTSTAFSSSSFAQDESSAAVDEMETISITGSAITRTALEGALPVTVVSKEQIVRSGVTSVPDLMATIPSMQGYQTAGQSVGGGAGGVQTASLRDLGGSYTLVLLNGRRMPSSDSGATVDLNAIPLSAIERVEVLTDGASALYGSDAIAGVINFILKKDLNETTITGRFDRPQEKGGASSNFSVSTGFGSLDDDGFNILLAYSHDSQQQLKSSQRDFASTGFLEFDYNGQTYLSVAGSANAIPANAYVSFTDESGLSNVSFNPYQESTGSCHDTSYASGTTCVFDYTSTLEIEPEYTRDNFFTQALLEINDDTQAYISASYSQFAMISRIAPYPTGSFILPTDSDVVQNNVIPYLTDEQAAAVDTVTARWRTLPGGNRTQEFSTDTFHVVAGIEGLIGDISYDFAVTNGTSSREITRVTGYPLQDEFLELVTSGDVNVFASPDELSDEQVALVQDAMFSGLWNTFDTSTFAIEGKASMPLFELADGDAFAAFGFDYRDVTYSNELSQANKDAVILFSAPGNQFDLSRSTYGIFGEFVFPLFENFELTTALRYDTIGGVTNDRTLVFDDTTDEQVFDADGYPVYQSGVSVNDDESDITYKLSFAYRPSDEWLLRGSYGTGFKAPTMREIADPRLESGVTSVAYACPFDANSTHPLADLCYTDILQYDVYQEGYAGLKPEKSTQLSFGFVYEPGNWSVGMDYWSITLEDQVATVTQDQIFNDPITYADLFTSKVDLGTGEDVLAIIQAPVNIGESRNSGIDWSVKASNEIGSGTLNTSFEGTLVLVSESLRVGEVGIWDDSLGKVGDDQAVTFRYIWNFRNTYSIGDFDLTANVRFRSGYDDVESNECLASDQSICNDVQLTIDPYILVDTLAAYHFSDKVNVSFGIKNLLDVDPPLTLNTAAGHQIGYDPRYSSAYGRTFYVSGSYTF
ncbi:TonB-dependent receptor plug domain-containing protein [Paraglaciecola sp. 2405UD69-4]|uniref:TonB-dependent receptor plug domain-containing protein n=1 Tax=Paraglaciecola sp. 2405UD69-4 TaxID=3391836 RepID=UPI0039C8C113